MSLSLAPDVGALPLHTAPDAAPPHPAILYLSGLGSDASRRAAMHGLRLAAGLLKGTVDDRGLPLADPLWIDWSGLEYHDAMRVRALMLNARKPDGSPRWAPSTVNITLAGIKGTMREAWRLGLVSSDTWLRVQDVRSVPVRQGFQDDPALLRGRRLDQSEIGAIVTHLRQGRTTLHKRDLALLVCLYLGGLRRAEVCALDVSDYDPSDLSLIVRRGKGGRTRTVYLHDDAREPMAAWIEARGDHPGPLLEALTRWGTFPKRRRGLTTQGIWQSVKRWCRSCSLADASPHDFRRSRASNLLAAGVDLSLVQRHLGHLQVTTTTRYDRRAAEASKAAAQRLGF